MREGAALKRGEGSRSGKPAVIVGVQKQPGANTLELTARLDRELDALQQELPPGMTIDRKIFRQADFIEVAVDNVVAALRDGGILVVIIVVLLFLANLRAAAITLIAMPLSLAAAVLVAARVRRHDQHDDARRHGDRHRRARRRRDHRRRERRPPAARERGASPTDERRPAAAVVRDATLEIRTSIVFATLIIVLVFLPIFFLSGVEGRLLAPLGVRLHRRAAGIAGRRDHRHAGALLCLPAAARRRSCADTTAGSRAR